MAELTPKERLQPSLLDRLTDDDPGSRVESADRRVLSSQRIRECVRRDLTWLFNTTNLEAVQDLGEYPEIERSTLNFGIPDLAGHPLSSIDKGTLGRLLRKAIGDFEPRLFRNSVKVEVVQNADPHQPNTMAFTIDAVLWAQPLPLRLYLRTELDLEDGEARVTEVAAA